MNFGTKFIGDLAPVMVTTNTPCVDSARVRYDHGLPDWDWVTSMA